MEPQEPSMEKVTNAAAVDGGNALIGDDFSGGLWPTMKFTRTHALARAY